MPERISILKVWIKLMKKSLSWFHHMSNVSLISSWVETNLLRMAFVFKWLKNKFLGCFPLILLVDVKAFPLACIWSQSENDLEEEFTYTHCGHATLFNPEKIFLVNKVAPLSFKWKPS